jgi:enoyl-CoA hydratase/carnithine racemase
VPRVQESNPKQPESEVLVQDTGRVRRVTLNRPERVNAFTALSYRSLARVLDEADGAGEVSVVLMEGAGRGFSSGVDLASISVEGEALGKSFDTLIESLIRFSKPLLAAVHGAAVGFGTTLLLHCDLVLVADTARLRFPFTALGTTPEAASSVLLPQIVGLQRAADLLLTSRWISGSEAAQMGLAARCCPEASLHSEAFATAQALSELPDAALAAGKRLVRAGATALIRDAFSRERAEAGALHEALGPIGYRGTSTAGLLPPTQQEVPPPDSS